MESPPNDLEIRATCFVEKSEQFGDGWPIVRLIMSTFAGLGIYLADVKPGNIEFAPPSDNRPA